MYDSQNRRKCCYWSTESTSNTTDGLILLNRVTCLMPYEEDKLEEFSVANNTMIMGIDCVKCGFKEGIGCITFGNNQMCMDCGNEFNTWM